jgi:hypothetical protein
LISGEPFFKKADISKAAVQCTLLLHADRFILTTTLTHFVVICIFFSRNIIHFLATIRTQMVVMMMVMEVMVMEVVVMEVVVMEVVVMEVVVMEVHVVMMEIVIGLLMMEIVMMECGCTISTRPANQSMSTL